MNNLLDLFQSRVADMGGWCVVAESIASILPVINERFQFEKNEIVYSRKAAGAVGDIELPGIDIGAIPLVERRTVLANAKLGITSCDGLIADTGTAVLVNDISEPREVSLIPERHLIITQSDRLFPTLDDYLQHYKVIYPAEKLPSITLISRPSRTSDIEKKLVMGVHGPREFGIIVIGI